MKKLAIILGILSCTKLNTGGIISLVPSADEIINYLKATEKLSGVSSYSPLKDSVRVVGDLINPDYEVIKSIKPEVVIISLPMQKNVKINLESMGIKTYDFSPESVEELYEEIIRIGEMVGKPLQSKKLADSVKRFVKGINPYPHFRFVVEISQAPVYIAGENTYISEVLEMFGGTNVFSDITGYKPVSTEEVLKRRFDILITPYKAGRRIGFENVCVVNLPYDYLSPGLKIFPLADTLRLNLLRCLKENPVSPVR